MMMMHYLVHFLQHYWVHFASYFFIFFIFPITASDIHSINIDGVLVHVMVVAMVFLLLLLLAAHTVTHYCVLSAAAAVAVVAIIIIRLCIRRVLLCLSLIPHVCCGGCGTWRWILP
eukprot:958904_1